MSGLQSDHVIENLSPAQEPERKRKKDPVAERQAAIERFDEETAREAQASTEASGDLQESADQSSLVNNAILLSHNGESELAKSLLIDVLRGNPNHIKAVQWMARISRQLGQTEDEQKFLRIWTRLEPNAEAFAELGRVQFEQGQDKESLVSLFGALDHIEYECPLLFEIYKYIGNVYVRIGDYDAAEEYYNKAYVMNPDNDVLLVNYGTMEIQRGSLARAVERFRQAVSLNADNDRAWVGLALTHRQFGDLELAWGNLERALDLNFSNAAALDLFVEWAVKESRLSAAIDRLEFYLKTFSQDVERSFCLSKLLYLAGRSVEAEVELEKALAFEPHLPGAMEFLNVLKQERAARATA